MRFAFPIGLYAISFSTRVFFLKQCNFRNTRGHQAGLHHLLRADQQEDQPAGSGRCRRRRQQVRERAARGGCGLGRRRGGVAAARPAHSRQQLGQNLAQPAREDAGPVQGVLLQHAQETSAG